MVKVYIKYEKMKENFSLFFSHFVNTQYICFVLVFPVETFRALIYICKKLFLLGKKQKSYLTLNGADEIIEKEKKKHTHTNKITY